MGQYRWSLETLNGSMIKMCKLSDNQSIDWLGLEDTKTS